MAPLKFASPVLEAPFEALLQDLRDGGASVWIVGGWVRDCVLGHVPHDADFCTNATDAQVVQAAKKADVAIVLDRVAAIHGTYRLAARGQTLDLARLRQDVTRLGARHAEVSFTGELHQDLSRRDLTINALALPYPIPRRGAAAALVDLHGGLQDLEGQVLRLIGVPEERLEEDPLRLLRVARFACMGPQWQVEAKTAAAMANQARLLPSVSVERRLAELVRALALPAPHRFWELLEAGNAFACLLPPALAPAARAQATRWLAHAAASSQDPLLRYCCFALGAVLPASLPRPLAAEQGQHPPRLALRPSSRNATLALMAPLRFSKAWQEAASTVAAAWVLAGTTYDDEAVVRWALALGPRYLAVLQQLCAFAGAATKLLAAPTAKVLARVAALGGKDPPWRSQDLNLDAPRLFSELEVGEGAIRRWLLLELLVHAWLHPKDNNQAALTEVAKQFNPTSGLERDKPA